MNPRRRPGRQVRNLPRQGARCRVLLDDPRATISIRRFQGYRLLDNEYMPIESVDGRLPSSELGLHLEDGRRQLRFFDPLRDGWLPTGEECAGRPRPSGSRRRPSGGRRRPSGHFEAAWRQASAEADQMRQELEALRRHRPIAAQNTSPQQPDDFRLNSPHRRTEITREALLPS